jgi:hypothetical protein
LRVILDMIFLPHRESTTRVCGGPEILVRLNFPPGVGNRAKTRAPQHVSIEAAGERWSQARGPRLGRRAVDAGELGRGALVAELDRPRRRARVAPIWSGCMGPPRSASTSPSRLSMHVVGARVADAWGTEPRRGDSRLRPRAGQITVLPYPVFVTDNYVAE